MARSCSRLASAARGADVGFVEIIALKQKSATMVLGDCVGEAITHVELRGMPASFAIARERGEGGLGIFSCYRDYFNASSFEKPRMSSSTCSTLALFLRQIPSVAS